VNDVFHLVVYDTDVEVLVKDGNLNDKPRLIEIVNSIAAKGSTNLAGGLLQGAELLKVLNSNEYLKRVLLFSDGLVNIGIKSPEGIYKYVEQIVEDGTNVSSLGLGTDYDEVLMRQIGERGTGNYFYIEHAEDITRTMSHCIHGLIDLYGTNGVLNIIPSDGKLVKIYDGIGNKFMVGDLNSDNTTSVLLKFEVEPKEHFQLMELFTYTLSYKTNRPIRENLTVNGHYSLPCSSQYSDLQTNIEVVISSKIKEFREKETVAKGLMNEKKYGEALALKKETIAELKEFIDVDTSGRIKVLVDVCEKGIIDLEKLINDKSSSGNKSKLISNAKKHFDTADYMVATETTYNWTYVQAEDSSSGD